MSSADSLSQRVVNMIVVGARVFPAFFKWHPVLIKLSFAKTSVSGRDGESVPAIVSDAGDELIQSVSYNQTLRVPKIESQN